MTQKDSDVLNQEKEIQKILKKLSEKNKETKLLTHIASQNHKTLTLENLIQELFILKQNKNENEAKIKILKVQIRKLEKPENKSREKKQNFAYDQEMYYLFRS